MLCFLDETPSEHSFVMDTHHQLHNRLSDEEKFSSREESRSESRSVLQTVDVDDDPETPRNPEEKLDNGTDFTAELHMEEENSKNFDLKSTPSKYSLELSEQEIEEVGEIIGMFWVSSLIAMYRKVQSLAS